jgi:anhydro-N-acetylmuramic acid kinase
MQSTSKIYLGIMSGTSLDGLDLALCQFEEIEYKLSFKLLAFETIKYDADWKERLSNVYVASAVDYFKFNSLYGTFIAEKVNAFLNKNNTKADYIASHGHTVFHQPANGFTTQIGCGATIAALTSIDAICDFRSLDVALNGQGAPLVPIGDRDLFGDYEACLNLGGIANISITKNNATIAFDVCMANLLLNYLSQTIGLEYDKSGELASKGMVNSVLLDELLSIETHFKSLGRELFEQLFFPILEKHTLSVHDKLATCVEYMVVKINQTLIEADLKSILITGGGAYNSFFINQLKKRFTGTITIPSAEIIEFKEAIIFAYLGYLRINHKVNTLQSVTKAKRDSVGACVYIGTHI